MLPEPVRTWLLVNGHGDVTRLQPVGGGSINRAHRLHTASGQTFFLKTNPACPPDMFAQEAAGLLLLQTPAGPRVPRPFIHDPHFFLLEDLNPAPPAPGYWAAMGRKLAALHEVHGPVFGGVDDNYLGSTPQPNPSTADGFEFFAEHRLGYQVALACRRGLLTPSDERLVARLASRLPDLLPVQPASLVHGDLWSGNFLRDEHGQPAVVDPAAHYGWAEADLAMTALFGAPPEEFYASYCEARPLPAGWRTRFPVYQVYHLLNHLNLFGGGYYGQAMALARRFA